MTAIWAMPVRILRKNVDISSQTWCTVAAVSGRWSMREVAAALLKND